ncbi:MAG: hypothetical protein Q4D93_02635 [Porphyromonas sp.]|nr:hypothetical protein [Porphyromonas sp.]
MKKRVFLVAALFIGALSLSSCESCGREKTTQEKVQEAAEAVGEDIKDGVEEAAEEIEDAADDLKKEIEK